jgi:predicted extracellular nuclease
MNRKHTLGKIQTVLLVASLLASFFVGFASPKALAQAIPVIINEVDSDTPSYDTQEFIELYDGGIGNTALDGLVVVLYNGSVDTSYDAFDLDGFSTDVDGYFVIGSVTEADLPVAPGSFGWLQNGADAVAIYAADATGFPYGTALTTSDLTDAIVYDTNDSDDAELLTLLNAGQPQVNEGGAGDKDNHSSQRCPNGSGGARNTDTYLQNSPTPGAENDCGGGGPSDPVIVNCGGTLYVDQTFSAYRDVTASDVDGTVDNMEISVIPASGAITLEGFVPAPGVGGEASATVTVGPNVDAGTFTVDVTATNGDATPQSGTCTFNVVVNPFLTIGEVQGVVEDTDSGTSHASPYEGEYVIVQGVIYEKTQEYRSAGGAYYGFFLQNTAATADSNPDTSDGIFVFHLQYPTLLVEGGGSYLPEIGDEVILRGPVQERYNNTRLNNPRLIQLVRSDVVLDDEIPAFDVNPPATIVDNENFDNIQDAYRYWERREGMRGQIPAGSTVLNGRDVFASSFDSEIWVARPDSLIAQRADAYERRSFRDMHPLDDIPSVGFDNDNPYRILMGTFGVKAVADDTTALLAPARTYDTLTQVATGGVYYNFGKYSIQVDEQIWLSDGVDPALNAPPQAFDRALEYSVVTFNVENLYDYYDDPFDGCDFQGNPGCPGVYPPFDYVPLNNDVYQARLKQIAQQIVFDLHSPDIIMAQEAEDQDVCTVVEWEYACGVTDDVDGKPDTLQELAAIIYNEYGVPYDAAYDRDGADDRGIVSAYLYRTDRVELLPAQADDPVLGEEPQVDYPDGLDYNTDVQNPKVLNAELPDWVTGDTDGDNVFTRAPQVGLFRLWRDGIGGSVFEDLYLIDNHFSSGPDGRVGQRTEQAAYNAAIVATLQQADPGVYVSVGGDLNVYPRPDDPFPPPDTSDQLAALYNQGMTNLWDILVTEAPASAYGYVYQGQAQTLDQIFVAPPWLGELTQVNSAHINSDFPADHPDDGPRGTSDHDPVVARYDALTLNGLMNLVRYYDANGEITGNQTTRILLDRLDRARRFMERGKQDAYEDQLWAFISQVWDFTPRFITEHAAQALEQETMLLLSLP